MPIQCKPVAPGGIAISGDLVASDATKLIEGVTKFEATSVHMDGPNFKLETSGIEALRKMGSWAARRRGRLSIRARETHRADLAVLEGAPGIRGIDYAS
jgi:hypothetical protein